ncbi:MAG: Ig-like domain-containing protein, partial [Lachnospiraceae bacterium]|nr:Ig-like domain-containing protein [Lachnospiraceae bacterium]
MNRNHKYRRLLTVLIIIELFLATAITGSIIDDYSDDKVRASAATLMDAIGQYVINIGSEYYRQGDELIIDRNSTVQLMYVDATGNVLPIAIDAGTTLEVEWNVLDDGGEVSSTVITATGITKNISGLKNYCELRVVGIGYTNLTARITMTDNTQGITSFIDYSWKVKVSLAIDNDNATDDSAIDGGDYGLRYAFSTDKSKDTLQISGPEVLTDADPDNDKYNSYLLLLKKANLLYEVNDGGTPRLLDNFATESDIELNTDLATLLNDNIKWTTSDSTVATVKYGVIRGVGAGQCVITATTESSDGRSSESVSVTVVVKPTGYVEGSSAGYQSNFVEIVDDNSFTIDTNAIDATQLIWTVHNIDINGDVLWSNVGNKNTDKFHVTLYNTGGKIYFSGVEAGAYFITAQVKGDYGESNTKIKKMSCTIIVPVKMPSGPLYINVSDTYSIIENSSIKDPNWYDYVSEDDAVASVHNGVITGEGSGETTIHLTRVVGAGYEDVYTPDEINAYVPASLDIVVRVVDTITLNYASYVMYVGGELKLRATTTNSTVVTWSSSDEAVAKVENGTVKALAVGTTVITASQLVEGVEKTAKCKITVRQAVEDIVLIPETAELNIGDNLTINAQVSPSLNGVTLSWNSSDESVVKITSYDDLSCTVYAAGGGNCTLTAINPDNQIVGYCQISVYAPITKITLSQTNVSLPLSAGWFQLYAEIDPPSAINNEIVWTSMDSSVATVDQNGIVTLKKPGSTSILVSAKTDASVFAVCNLEVTKTVTGIKLDATTHDMYVGDTFRLTYTVSPAGATNAAVTWQSSNTSVATVDQNGLVTAKGVGSAVIICKTQDGGYSATCTVNVGRVATVLKLDVTKLTLNT